MYKPMEEVDIQIDNRQIIWKYMPYEHLYDLLKENKIYCRAINRFEDRLEGNINALTEEAIYDYYFKLKHDEAVAKKMTKEYLEHIDIMRSSIFVNCWHINNYENYAMWKIYGKERSCVAVKTTFKNLCNSLVDKNYIAQAGKVKYIDFQNEILYDEGAYTHALYKGEPYNYENELRVLVNSIKDRGKEYILMDIASKILVEHVYISPFVENEERNNIKNKLGKLGVRSVKDSVLIDNIKLKDK